MRITQTTKNKKIIVAIIVVFLLIVTGAFVWYLNNNPNKKQTEEIDRTSAVQEEQANANNDDDESTLPSKTPTDEPTDHSTTAPSSPPEQPNLLRADGGDSVKVVATFQQASSGYCELLMTKTGSQDFTKETNVVIGTNYYSCSFSIPASSLTSGQWSLRVIHHIGDSETSSDTREVTIN